MTKRRWFLSENYHWFSAFMGLLSAACLVYARFWRLPDIPHWQAAFMIVFLGWMTGGHVQKARAARREKSRGV